MKFGDISTGTVLTAIVAEQAFIDAKMPTPSDWAELPYGVGIGWTFSGGVFTGPDGQSPPPPPGPKYRTLLTSAEWVMFFTDDEWDWIDSKYTTTPRTNAIKELRKMRDAIRMTASVDVAHKNMNQFYTWLLNNGIPGGQTRIDELRQGVEI